MHGPNVDDPAAEVTGRSAVWRDSSPRAAQDNAVAIAGWGQSESSRGWAEVVLVSRLVGVGDDEPGALPLRSVIPCTGPP
jgi:hypothetical protein